MEESRSTTSPWRAAHDRIAWPRLAPLRCPCARRVRPDSHYDATSYQNATNLKAEALLLIEKAKDPPGKHATPSRVSGSGYCRPMNTSVARTPESSTVEQWRLLIDPDAALLVGS